MLLDNFYSIIDEVEIIDGNGSMDNPVGKFTFTIKLNPGHPIYKGHFPGNPVVPGVCQIQMIKELTSLILKKNLVIYKSDNIKFLAMIIPTEVPFLKVNIEIKEKDPDFCQVMSVILRDDQVCLKFKGIMSLNSKQI
jgi:3-hydroxyacyl-[acyl-carrier-protein] dehydratase